MFDVHASDFVTIALLVALEGLLSADNAMVLAVLVLSLPRHQQQKALRYRLLPTPTQEALFGQWAGARRWTFNDGLGRRIAHSKATGKTLSYNDLAGELTVLKRQPETAWLRDGPAGESVPFCHLRLDYLDLPA